MTKPFPRGLNNLHKQRLPPQTTFSPTNTVNFEVKCPIQGTAIKENKEEIPDSWANRIIAEPNKVSGSYLYKIINIHTISVTQEVEVYIMTADQSYDFKVWLKTQTRSFYERKLCRSTDNSCIGVVREISVRKCLYFKG